MRFDTKNKREFLVTEYHPEIAVALRHHISQGWSALSYCGIGRIPMNTWHLWLKTIPELREINEAYKKRPKARRT